MNFFLKPYPSYKDSGVDWLREMPEHWKVSRLKHLCSQSALYGANIAATHYTQSGVRFIRTSDVTDSGDLKRDGVYLPKDVVVEYLLQDGDILISRSGTIGRSFLYKSQLHGRCAYAGYLVRFVLSSRILSEYVFLFTKTLDFERFLRVMAISSTIENFNGEKYANAWLPLPPLSEQTAIVRYLDYVDRRVRRFVRAKEKLIDLLNEQKQIIIHQVVTGQVDVRTGQPYPAYKPSGVECLGDVPEYWEAQQLGRIGQFSKGGGGTKEDEIADGIPCVRYGDLYTQYKYFIESNRACISEQKAVDYTPLQYGDVLFAGSGETIDEIGKSAVSLLTERAYCGGDVIIFRPCIEIDAKFLGYATDCPQAIHQKARMGRGITVMHIYGSELKYLWIFLPPLPEQTAIVKYLDKTTAAIDTAITRTRREIELVNEYRTRLIADVVTGKLDVREAAAQLPNATEHSLH